MPEQHNKPPRRLEAASVGPLLHHVTSPDGKLAPLILQCFQDVRELPPTRQWQRLGAMPPSPATLLGRLTYWIAAPILRPGTMDVNLSSVPAVAEAALRLLVALPLSSLMFHGFEFMSPPFHSFYINSVGLSAGPDHRYQPVWHRGGGAHRATRDGSRTAQRRPLYTDDVNLEDAGAGAGAGAEPELLDDATAGQDDASAILLINNNQGLPNSDQGLLNIDQGIACRPRYLCRIADNSAKGYEVINVAEFIGRHGSAGLGFVFVSYTRRQFRVSTDAEIDAYPYPDEATREANRTLAAEDRRLLARWGIHAARAAGRQAFWLDFECVRESEASARSVSRSDDVYRICDVVRAAHSMIIATGPPAQQKVRAIMDGEHFAEPARRQLRQQPAAAAAAAEQWLREWGSRLWTLPELLLCPRDHGINIYVLGRDDMEEQQQPETIDKRNFPERAWDDAGLVKELVHHYEASAILSPVRLMETALECFARRGTDPFSAGDVAYALMGLFPMSQRPAVRRGDTWFQAFARLSLKKENDGGDVLSRMIGMFPPEPRDGEKLPALRLHRDRWGAKMHDMHATVHVVGLAADAPETLLINHAPSAAIRWDGFDGVNVRLGELPRSLIMLGLVGWFAVMSMGALVRLLAPEYVSDDEAAAGSKLAALCFTVGSLGLFAPVVYLWWQTRPWPRTMKAQLTGIEGHVDAATVERHLWGCNHGRLAHVAPSGGAAAAAAAHHGGAGDTSGGAAEGEDNRTPAAEDSNTSAGTRGDGILAAAAAANQGNDGNAAAEGARQTTTNPAPSAAPPPRAAAAEAESKFTLVDTHMMTVTHIHARRPPVALFIVGSEGGHERAILCSYDWRDDTFERETVVRVRPRMLESMRRLDNFRLRLSGNDAIDASDEAVTASAGALLSSDALAGDGVSRWRLELMFVTLVFLALGMLSRFNWAVDAVYEEYRNSQVVVYAAAFVAMQPLSFILLKRLPITRFFTQLAFLNGALPALLTLVPHEAPWSPGGLAREAILGAAEGLFFPALLAVLCSWWWLSPGALAARSLLLVVLSGFLPAWFLFLADDDGDDERDLQYLVYLVAACSLLLHVAVAVLGRNRVGRPEEVGWVPATARRRLGQPLARGPAPDDPWWRPTAWASVAPLPVWKRVQAAVEFRRHSSRQRKKYMIPGILFLVSMLVYTGTLPPEFFNSYRDEAARGQLEHLHWFMAMAAILVAASSLLVAFFEQSIELEYEEVWEVGNTVAMCLLAGLAVYKRISQPRGYINLD
ncbi:3-hydroxyisobutyrate dehydrogenase protein [Cordyceps javanica]|uniref:3-hydroxyisobutyrate dehydrogenase protein n=1 Tax=Cordyceps javanica TaxID=43265 RepID=A0A545VW14_9HYPO|nr:3-hydroxyisobutyrate dehydrogenase protein [Cordyceps javanica]TQW05907.1 hypothetical protein IF2G_06189 [Cordyceps javanica]